jgi:hypothetical protein
MGIFNFFEKEQREPEWISLMPEEYTTLFLSEIKGNPQANTLDEIKQGIGKYGFDKTNPIPVYGIPENEKYLSRLRTMRGEKLRWRRIRSLEVSNINKAIDEYEIFNLLGDTITLLYISPYHLKTSNKAPDGFKLI